MTARILYDFELECALCGFTFGAHQSTDNACPVKTSPKIEFSNKNKFTPDVCKNPDMPFFTAKDMCNFLEVCSKNFTSGVDNPMDELEWWMKEKQK